MKGGKSERKTERATSEVCGAVRHKHKRPDRQTDRQTVGRQQCGRCGAALGPKSGVTGGGRLGGGCLRQSYTI